MLEIHIHIRQEHIDAGNRADCRRCPAALALMETFPMIDVSVSANDVSLGGMSFDLPDHIQTFIDNFDMGIPQIPTSFKMQFEDDDLNEMHLWRRYAK